MDYKEIFKLLGKEDTLPPESILKHLETVTTEKKTTETQELLPPEEEEIVEDPKLVEEINKLFEDLDKPIPTKQELLKIVEYLPEGVVPETTTKPSTVTTPTPGIEEITTFGTIETLSRPVEKEMPISAQELQSILGTPQEIENIKIPEMPEEIISSTLLFSTPTTEPLKTKEKDVEDILKSFQVESTPTKEETHIETEPVILPEELPSEEIESIEKEIEEAFPISEEIESKEIGSLEETLPFEETTPIEESPFTAEEKFFEEIEDIEKGLEEARTIEEETPEIKTFEEEFPIEKEETKAEEFVPSEVIPEKPIEPEETPTETYQTYVETSLESLFSPEKIKQLKLQLRKYPKPWRYLIRDVLVNEIIPESEIPTFISMILAGEDPLKLKEYLSTKVENIDDILKSIEEEIKSEREERRGRKVINIARETPQMQTLRNIIRSIPVVIFTGVLVSLIGFYLYVRYSTNKKARDLYLTGLRAIENKDFTSAEEYFSQAKRITGPIAKWYNSYGLKYFDVKEYRRALDKFYEGLRYFPNDWTMITNTVYVLVNSTIYNKFTIAENLLEKLKSYGYIKDPFDFYSQLFYIYYRWYEETQDPSKLLYIIDYIKAKYLALRRNDKRMLFKILFGYSKLNDLENAKKTYFYIKKVDKNATEVESFTEFSRLLLDKGEIDLAKNVLFELWKNPNAKHHDEYYYQLARYFYEGKDIVKVQKALTKVTNINPNNYKAYVFLGKVAMDIENIEKAKKYLETARIINPEYPDTYKYLGLLAYKYLEDYPYALQNYLTYYRLRNGEVDDEMLYEIGWLFFKLGDFDNAEKYWQILYTRDLENPVISQLVGTLLIHNGNYKPAINNFKKAIEYYERELEKIGILNPRLIRHRVLVDLLSAAYNNLGVAYYYIYQSPEAEEKAMEYFWKAVDIKNQIGGEQSAARSNLRMVLHSRENVKKKLVIDYFAPKEMKI